MPASTAPRRDLSSDARSRASGAAGPLRASTWPPLAVFALFALISGLLGYADYMGQRRALEEEKRNELMAIADLKVGQLNEWLRERRANAEVLVDDSLVGIEAKRWLKRGGADDPSRARLLQHLQSMQTAYDYHAVILLDEQADVRLAVNPGVAVGAVEKQLAREAMRAGHVLFSDLHYEPGATGVIELDVFAPLLVRENGVTRAIGALYFSIDARRYLFKLIQSWPTPSPSGETLLVRRDGNDVLFLNELRHRKDTGLALRIPVNDFSLPAARAVRGETGAVEGIDYRGVPVLAVLRPVANLSWHLVTKVDRAEIFIPLGERARLDVILATILFAAAALALAFWWRRQQTRLLMRHYRDMARLNATLEQRVKRRTARLQAINEELDAYSYSISHDLRAPLRAIHGFADIVAERHCAAMNEEGRHYVDNIAVAARHMDRMIDDLRRYAHLDHKVLRHDARPLRDVLAEAAAEFGARAKEAGATLVFPEAVPVVAVNKTLVAQILGNLISNALIYRRADVPPRVEVGCEMRDDKLLLSVADNGIGIAPEHHDIIFKVFQRLHGEEDYPGTGIGLALVKKACGLLGGRVWLESTPGLGSTFHVEIPAGGDASKNT